MLKTIGYKLLLILFMMSLLTFMGKSYSEPDSYPEYMDDEVYIKLVIRDNDQLTAFYVGREFPDDAIDEILKTCFITPIVKNMHYEALWVEPDSWRLTIDKKKIQRIKRDYWKDTWSKVGLSQGHQATFGWTLMPESRDLRFDEGVGGSIVIPKQEKPFKFTAHFNTGFNKKGEPKIITFENVSCAN